MHAYICNNDEVFTRFKLITFFALTNSSYKASLIIKIQQLKMKYVYRPFQNTK